MRLSKTFSALGERNFRLFVSGQVLSLTGTWVNRLAIASLVYEVSGYDEQWLGWVAAAPLIPVLLLSLPAGALADRMDLRRLVLTTQSLMLLGSAVLTVLVACGVVTKGVLLLFAAWSGAMFAVDAPGRQALVHQLVPPEKLANAIALNATSFNAARIAGGALFALLIWLADYLGGLGDGPVFELLRERPEVLCLALNTLSFFYVIAALLDMRDLRPRRKAEPDDSDRGVVGGLAYAARTPVVRATLLLVVTVALFGFQLSHLLPVYAEKVWFEGKEGFGTLSAALGCGALCGALFVAPMLGRVHRGRWIVGATVVGPACLLLVAASRDLPFEVGLGAVFLCGFVFVQSHIACNTELQSTVPDHLRGRVLSLFTLSVLTAFPLGGLIAGQLSRHLGAPLTSLVDAAVVLVVAATIHALHPQLWRPSRSGATAA